MYLRTILPYRLSILVLALAALWAMPRGAGAQETAGADGLCPRTAGSENNSLETRQFRIDNARLPVQASSRQSVLAWQVTQGTWNGQVLDGLCLVLVKSTSEDGRSLGHTSCYISQEATLAQRQALLLAFMAAQPQEISSQELGVMRMEPAVITLEIDGQTVVLHLGLVA